ncbi:dethiobiotin synthase [Natronococcus roseus]|uniref:dethiobiotin synthase n=1 Tax=Natronococcus roseus TaxID=1052014 RepID=UPI00374DB5E1
MSDSTTVAVVGTDTGVGKTVVTAGLARELRERGVDARAIKPAQTGHPPDDDAAFVVDACGTDEAATCLRYLEEPLAPRVAAERADDPLEYESLLADCRRECERVPVALLEGIGGLRVPLAGDREVVDLVADLASGAVVVTRSGLGTLNHTALTVDALERRGVDVFGIVCNGYEGASVAERTNPGEIDRMTDRPVETVPPLSGSDPTALADGVRDALSRSFADRLVEKA